MEIPIFPLRTVLFPGGLLPLKIFEQRYLDMTKACIRDDSPFGVCLIRDGAEVGAPAMPYHIGCTARIAEWDMPHLGIFNLMCRGESVFRITEHWVAKNGLAHAAVELCPAPAPLPLPAEHQALADLLAKIIDKLGASNFPAPVMLDDANWVCSRLIEALPLEPEFKQRMLELGDVQARLQEIGVILQDKRVEM
jgi:uncharacterized protein